MKLTSKQKTRWLTGCAVLTGIAVILQYIEISIPLMPSFIKLDFSDFPEIIGAFAYGPLAGCTITVLKNVIHMMVSQSGFVGELSNALLGCCMSAICGLVYKYHKSKKGALIGGISGAIMMSVASFPINLFIIYPLYFNILGYPESAIIAMYKVINPHIETLAQALLIFNVPFTLFKGLIDVFFCMIVYKRISHLLHGDEK